MSGGMKNLSMILMFAGAVAFAQGPNQPAPAMLAGPGANVGDVTGTPRSNPPGPGERGAEPRALELALMAFAPELGEGPSDWAGGPEGGPGGEPAGGPESMEMDGAAGPGQGPGAGAPPEFGPGPAGMGPGGGIGPRGFGGPGGRGGPGGPDGAWKELLGLDDKQAQSLRQIGRERMRKMDEAQFKLRQKQGEFADLLEQENPDGNALAGTVKSLHALRKQAAEIDKEYRAKTEAVLNAEQLKKWKEFEQTRRGPRPGPAEGPMGPMPPQGGPDGPGGPGAGRD